MIILYSSKINLNFSDILNRYESLNIYNNFRCPNCESYNNIKWGSYARTIYYINQSIIKCKVINIKRIKCKDCGKTHALLPSFIVPYKLFALDVILSSLSNNIDTINISFDTFIKWNKQFNKCLPYLKTMFKNLFKAEIISKLKNNIFEYYKRYFYINRKILMMFRAGFYNMAPF